MTFSPSELHTVQVVPLTGFDSAGNLNLVPMRRQTERLIEAGVRALIPCAGSSEFHTLLPDEIVQCIEMTRQVVKDRARIIAPVGLQLKQAIRLGKQAKDVGADALLVMPLAFPYMSDAGARDYYQSILDEVALPTLIYKKSEIPTDQLLLDLADHPNMIGVKYSVNNMAQYQAVVESDQGRVSWYCGSAERFAPYYFLAGAPGYTSGAANICPRVSLAMHAALASGDFQQALQWQRKLLPIEHYRARDADSYNVTFLKYAATHLDLDFGQPRPPYRRLTKQEQGEIDQLMPSLLAAERELSG